jgi:predicted branched-subunit amino acid permease
MGAVISVVCWLAFLLVALFLVLFEESFGETYDSLCILISLILFNF